jgi:cytochrome P450
MATHQIPTVSTWQFLRNALSILKNPLPFHHRRFEQLGDTFRLHLGFGKHIIFSRNAGLARHALQKNHRNYQKTSIQTRDLAKYVGKGLLTAEGDHWKRQRRLIQPAFHKKQLAKLLDAMSLAIDAELEKIVIGRKADIFPVFNDLAFQVVVKSLFSSAVSQQEIDRLQYITEAAQRMLVRELRQPYLHWWFVLSRKIEKHIDLTREARSILHRLVEARKASGRRYDDLLDMLLEARYEDGTEIEEEQLIDEILILFTAGHETTSNALTFTCELLARHPEAQQAIATEAASATAPSSGLSEFLARLPYTKQVIEEAMRLYPPAYFIDRVNTDDDHFEGMNIPAGTDLLFSIYQIHRHPDLWEDPDAFRPERFDPEKPGEHSAYYFPFGAGPRMCIGNNFAMYEMMLAVSQLALRFIIKPKTTPIAILPLITLKPKDAILEFVKRPS